MLFCFHTASCFVLWPSGFQVHGASGQPIGRVEQSHGDILSDGSSCGAWAMLPNCQADFSTMRRGKKAKQTESWHNLPSPSSVDEHRETSLGIAGGRDETESEI